MVPDFLRCFARVETNACVLHCLLCDCSASFFFLSFYSQAYNLFVCLLFKKVYSLLTLSAFPDFSWFAVGRVWNGERSAVPMCCSSMVWWVCTDQVLCVCCPHKSFWDTISTGVNFRKEEARRKARTKYRAEKIDFLQEVTANPKSEWLGEDVKSSICIVWEG